MFPLRHRARLVAGHLILDHVLRNEKQTIFEQADSNIGTTSTTTFLIERGQNGDRAEHASHDVVGGGADTLRVFTRSGHGGEPRHHLHDLIERRAMLVRSGQKTFVPADNEVRMPAAQFLGAEPLLLQLPVAKIFQEHVGAGQQPMHGVAIVRFCEIEHDAALAAVEQRKKRRSHAAQAAGLVTRGRLDLNNLGAELRQDHAARWAHHHVGHFDDPHAR